MSYSGDAAEHVVRMSLETGEVAETPAAAEPMNGQETEDLLDAILSPVPSPALEDELPVPERPAPEQDIDEFLAAVLGANPTREEGQNQNPTEGRVAKSRQSEPTLKPKEPAAQGISDSPERSRRSVWQELSEIRSEQREKAAGRNREKSQAKKPGRHLASPKKKFKKAKER